MSNATYLIATDDPGPTLDPTGESRYAVDEIIASGPVTVPLFWLALFERRHWVDVAATTEYGEDIQVPSLVVEREEGIGRLHDRSELILDAFPEFGPTLDVFLWVLGQQPRRFLKVDPAEVWDMVPDEFEPQLEGSLRWFVAPNPADFDLLLDMASIACYDPAQQTFPQADPDIPRAFNFRGYAWNDEWDNRADV